MKIFSSEKLREWDTYTIMQHYNNSAELMETAAKSAAFDMEIMDLSGTCAVFCSTGNNGGDGLCIAKLLSEKDFDVTIFIVGDPAEGSDDFLHYMKGIIETDIPVQFLSANNFKFEIDSAATIIDCIFGIGINRPIEGWVGQLIDYINTLSNVVFSLDLPSGLLPDLVATQTGSIILADTTFTLSTPKLAFMFQENYKFVGEFFITNIGLDPNFHQAQESEFTFYDDSDVRNDFITRNKFSHKNTFGHVRIIAGSKGKMGAALLSSRAAMRAGAGLVTVSTPGCGLDILQTALPEAMCEADTSQEVLSNLSYDKKYSATAIGPGIGQAPETSLMLRKLLKDADRPLVIDADALNIIASKTMINDIPANSILTPHIGEFDRLFGKHENSFDRFHTLRQKAIELQLIIVLKGAYTAVAFPNGSINFNSTGNVGMATAGSGDVLTGIIVSLLAQGYSPEAAARFGVYLHGNAGDIASGEMSYESVIASDIIESLPETFKYVHEEIMGEI